MILDTEILPDSEALAYAAAARIAEAIRAKQGVFSLVLAGGTTPIAAYRYLAQQRLEWSNVHFFWGDERQVAPADPQSNYFAAKRALLDHVSVPSPNIHRIHAEIGPAAASEYEAELHAFFKGTPVFDFLVLGMGEDGHTASLFPGNDALAAPGFVTAVSNAPKPPPDRITLTYGAIRCARTVVVLVAGEGKAAVLNQIRRVGTDVNHYPVTGAVSASGKASWLLDRAAASGLEADSVG
jgi:6-phosphogluconolactonase